MSDPAHDQNAPHSAPGDTTPTPVVPAVSIDRIFAEMAQQSRTLTACIAVNKARLLPTLSAACIAVVEVEYYGEGDSGGVDGMSSRNSNNDPIDLPDTQISLQTCNWNGEQVTEREYSLADGIEAFALDVIESRYAGWENNDGACGIVRFLVAEDRIELEHGTKSIHYDFDEF